MLPHDSLERYFAEVETAAAQLPAYAESYVEEILTAERANLRIRLRFENGASAGNQRSTHHRERRA